MTSSPTATPDDVHIRRLLRLPRSGIGHLIATTRGDHGKLARALTWIDVAGDGRYLLRSGDDVEVFPASANTVRRELDQLIPERSLSA
jgi:hypothetical protein